MQHRAKSQEETRNAREAEEAPNICMDYGYMSKQDQDEQKNPFLVIIDEGTGERFARMAGRKGIGENGERMWLVRQASEELKAWGHPGGGDGRIILKSDGEASIVAFRDALARFHGGVCIPETSARGESQSNGIVEEAGQQSMEW